MECIRGYQLGYSVKQETLQLWGTYQVVHIIANHTQFRLAPTRTLLEKGSGEAEGKMEGSLETHLFN